MPTVQGDVKPLGDTGFMATFLINHYLYRFKAEMGKSVEFVTCREATLTYDSISELTSTRSYDGTIGPHDISFNISNGPKITGRLDGYTTPSGDLSSSGSWSNEHEW